MRGLFYLHLLISNFWGPELHSWIGDNTCYYLKVQRITARGRCNFCQCQVQNGIVVRLSTDVQGIAFSLPHCATDAVPAAPDD
jgi:hypothetical protein